MKIECWDTKNPISYEELTKDLDIPGIVKPFGFKPEAVHVISPEEYMEKYADFE